MYLHHLTDSHEAGERLERFFRWALGRRAPAPGPEELPATLLRAGDDVAIRMEIPGLHLQDVRVDGDVLTIKLSSRAGGSGEDARDEIGRR